jgi:hypothetical protein
MGFWKWIKSLLVAPDPSEPVKPVASAKAPALPAAHIRGSNRKVRVIDLSKKNKCSGCGCKSKKK